MAVTSALVDNATRTGSTGTTSTVSGASFGTAAADRVLVVAYGAGANTDPSACTIGGVSATLTNITGAGIGIASAVVPTGTSGNIVFTLPSSDTVFTNGVVALSGAANATPSDTIAVIAGSGNIDVGAGGSLVAFSFASGAGSWTGAADLRTDGSIGVTLSTASFDNGGGALTNRAVSYSTAIALAAVAFDAGGGSPFSVAADGGTYSVTGASVVLRQKPDWTLVGITETAVDASGDYALSEPTGAQQDDILVVDIAIRSNVLHTNADWTFPQSDSTGNTTNNTTGSIVSYQTGYCIRGASPPSYVFAKTGGSRCLGTVRAYRSSVTGTPSFDTSAEVAMGAASGTVTLTGGVTTAVANELLVTGVFGARANTVSNMDGATEVTGNSGATDTTSLPVRGTWTERSDRNNGTSPTVALACYDTIKVTAGSTGDLTATESQSARHGMTVMAFKHPAGSNKTIAALGGSYAITGATVATRLGRKVAANGGSYAVTGASVTLRRNLPLVVGGGSYSVTGSAVTLREARKVSALGGSYAVTGANVTLRYGYAVAANGGSYAITGAAATLRHAYLVSVGGGSYSINGSAVTLTKTSALTLAAGAGSYAISGAAVSLLHKWIVSAAGSSYAVTGAAVTLRHAYKLTASGGSYSVTGASVTLTKTSAASLAADAGSYSITGANVSLLQTRYVNAGSGSYLITGSDVAINFGVAPGNWVPVATETEEWTRKNDAASTWTEATKTPEGWTRINEPSSSWTEVTASQETWTRIN